MGKFSKIFNHIESKDLRNKYEQKKTAKIKEEKKEEELKQYLVSTMEKHRYNWREGMTTSAVSVSKEIEAAPGDGTVTPVDAIDVNSYTGTTGVLAANDDLGANVGTQIRASGSGSGHGGFNVGGNYLAFQGTGSGGANARFAVLSAVDSTNIDTLQIKAIVGNDFNGGEDPDAAGEELYLMYKTPAMPEARFLIQKPDGSIPDGISGTEDIIIALGAAPNAGLNDYSITIPDYARAPGTQFILMQPVNSGVGFDHYGVTEIKFQRKAPIAVFVPLDNPEASSFIRSAPEGSTPKKRKKNVNDKLDASDEYTQAKFGNEFPGQEVRVGGEDPFKGAEIGDDVEPSPQTKDEVKKSFSKFSDRAVAAAPQTTVRGAPTAQPEAEPEPVAPSSQTTMAPTNDDGDPIPVKSVGGKNSGIVQGADAANVDAQEPEPEPTEPEPETPELDPEELKASEEEKQGKTPEEVEEIENEKINKKVDETADYIDGLIDFDLNLGLSSFNAFTRVTGNVINAVISVVSAVSLLRGATTVSTGDGFLGGLGKLKNSIHIARGVLSGKVVNTKVLPQEYNTFVKSLKVDEFSTKQIDNRSLNKINISDVRHEYADDNIYVKDGKIYQNGDGKDKKGLYATPLAGSGFDGLGNHGFGYAQMIIPKDGSEPYLHYYDHNYDNINNYVDVSASGGIIQSMKSEYPQTGAGPLLKSISNIIHQLKGDNISFITSTLRDTLLSFLGKFDQVLGGLKSTSSLEGFPPGIHGSALTDFKVPLSKLPQETQDMIAKHPLSWTPERIENMTPEQINEQLFPLLETDEQFENYLDFTTDITKMSVEPVNTVPYAVAMQEMDEIYEQYENDLLQKYGEDGWDEFTSGLNRETSEFFAAERAANEDLKTLESEERKELDENNRLRGPQAESDLWDKLVGPYFDALQKITSSGGYYDKNNPTYKKMVKGHTKWKKEVKEMQKEASRIQSEIMDKYRDQREPIENIAYEQLMGLREPVKDSPTGQARWKIVNRDGDASSGADYTALDGTVYKGKNTYYNEYYNEEENYYNQMSALYDPVADLQKYVDGAFVREGFTEKFEDDFGFSSENWSPEKSGDGVRRGDDPFVDPFANEIKPNLGAKPGDQLAMAGANYDMYNWILKTYGMPAAEWYLKTGKTNGNPFVPYGSYFPRASNPDVDFGTVASVGGIDSATTAATAAAASGGDKKKKKKKETRSSNIQLAHYQPKGDNILEKYARPQPKRGHLFEKIKSKGFFNPDDIKPEFPENPPPKLDPKTGMHPQYGKKAKRYGKLDPISANSMPPTGDPETDAVVNKQKTINKIKKMARNK